MNINIPYSVGDTVYTITNYGTPAAAVRKETIMCIHIFIGKKRNMFALHTDYGSWEIKDVFSSEEEALNVIKEMEKF